MREEIDQLYLEKREIEITFLKEAQETYKSLKTMATQFTKTASIVGNYFAGKG